MRRLPLIAIAGALVLLHVGSAASKAMLLPLKERVGISSFIGLVDVVATIPSSSSTQSQPRPRLRFLQIAVGSVVQTVKGPQRPAEAIQIDFDNGFACPNVFYEPGQTYLVFLERGSDGRLSTVNFGSGRYKVDHGMVDGQAIELQSRVTLETALDALEQLIIGKGDA